MLEEVDKMGCLVTDLLALTRADSNSTTSIQEELELGAVVREETARLSVLAEDKEQNLKVTIGHPCPVLLDKNCFRQAFANILHNAIQYSPPKTAIEIRVDTSPAGCFVEIADAGPGIAPEHQQHIFDRFYRVDKVRSRNNGGSGLGLAIALGAIESQGGRIELTSTIGNGSVFRIVLPESQTRTDNPVSQ